MKRIKKYNIVTVFTATTCDFKVSKEKEKRLKQIKEQIIKLYQEQKDIFANQDNSEGDGK